MARQRVRPILSDDMNPLGMLLKTFRERGGYTRDGLAVLIETTYNYIYSLEEGLKRPSRNKLLSVAGVLELNPEETNQLLAAANFPTAASPQRDQAIRLLESVLNKPGDTQDFIRALSDFVHRWRDNQQSKAEAVTQAIVPAGGWQYPVLGKRFESTLLHAIDEAARAGITDVIVIIPKDALPLQTVLSAFPRIARTFIQQEANSLGQALLAFHQSYPVTHATAVILPDEVDRKGKGSATSEIVAAYNHCHRPVIAVNVSSVREMKDQARYFGIAVLGKQVDLGDQKMKGMLHEMKELHEKPGEQTRLRSEAKLICGRYVLTPRVFDALAAQKPNRETSKKPFRYELTEALNLRGFDAPYVYTFNRDLDPLAKIREMFRSIDSDSVFDFKKYTRDET